jgi:predicted alpha/beta hydrolase family esterase
VERWSERLVETVEAHPYSWIVAHSLGVALVTRLAASRLDLRIAGALLVAPADVERMEGLGEELRGFGPFSLAPLAFPATVVASRTDRWMQFRRARMLAAAWGARLVDYGDAGHINVAAGFGAWPDGVKLLAEVRARRSATVIGLQPRSRDGGGRRRALH